MAVCSSHYWRFFFFFFPFRTWSFGSFCNTILSCFLKNWCCTIWDCTFTVELSELNHTVTIYNMWICTGIRWNSSGCKLVVFNLEIGVVWSATLLWKILGMHLIGGHCCGAGNLQRAWFSETYLYASFVGYSYASLLLIGSLYYRALQNFHMQDSNTRGSEGFLIPTFPNNKAP